MDYDEFDKWNETFTHRECDVMAMSYADFQAEKVNKEAVAGAGSTSSAVQLVLAPSYKIYLCVNSTLYFCVTPYLCVT